MSLITNNLQRIKINYTHAFNNQFTNQCYIFKQNRFPLLIFIDYLSHVDQMNFDYKGNGFFQIKTLGSASC